MVPHSDITSRPVYRALQPARSPGRHFLVLQAGSVTAAQQSELELAFAPVQSLLQTCWVGVAGAVPAQARPVADLAALADVLVQSRPVRVSDRLYVLGTEPFVWAAAEAAGRAGWTPDQWQLSHAGSLQRKVWCTHCHGITEGVTHSIVACAGCGRSLLVRDHFSARHAAFMGVMVDAEVPGEVPAAEEVFL